MNPEEKKQILKMVEDGKISAEEAMKLIKALEDSSVEMEIIDASQPPFEKPDASEFEKVVSEARHVWQILLWIGVGITILSGYWLYTLINTSNFGFWFYCAWMPLLLGVILLAVSATSSTSHWLFLKAENNLGKWWPQNITLSFPLPFGIAIWLLRNFSRYIHNAGDLQMYELVNALVEGISLREPLIVGVDDHEHSARVSFYIV